MNSFTLPSTLTLLSFRECQECLSNDTWKNPNSRHRLSLPLSLSFFPFLLLVHSPISFEWHSLFFFFSCCCHSSPSPLSFFLFLESKFTGQFPVSTIASVIALLGQLSFSFSLSFSLYLSSSISFFNFSSPHFTALPSKSASVRRSSLWCHRMLPLLWLTRRHTHTQRRENRESSLARQTEQRALRLSCWPWFNLKQQKETESFPIVLFTEIDSLFIEFFCLSLSLFLYGHLTALLVQWYLVHRVPENDAENTLPYGSNNFFQHDEIYSPLMSAVSLPLAFRVHERDFSNSPYLSANRFRWRARRRK